MTTATLTPNRSAPTQPKRSRGWTRRLLFILVIDGILLGMAELIAGMVRPFYYDRVAAAENLAASKAPGERRIFVYGESTIYGVPYGPNNSTARWLEAILHEVLPNEPIRVINFGGPGQGSQHLLNALEKTIGYQPDAIVMCVGHNEFLAAPLSFVTSGPAHRWGYFHCHLYRVAFHALPGLHERLGKSGDAFVGIPPWSPQHAEVENQYRRNVDIMAALAGQKQVPLVLAMPGCYGPWPPNQSQHRQAMSEEGLRSYAARLKAARQAVDRGEGDEADIRQLIADSDQFAEAHYCLGRVLEQSGRRDEAYDEFYKSLDLDCVPLRGQSPNIAILREIGAADGAPFINCREIFREHSPDRTPGGNLFIDHCHPRPYGQYLMAEAIARSLRDQGRLAAADRWHWDRLPTYATCLNQIHLTPEEWRAAERGVLVSALTTTPAVAVDMTALPPPFAEANDPEWRALHLLAMWKCGRQAEVCATWKQLHVAERAALGESHRLWPAALQTAWTTLATEVAAGHDNQ